MKDLFEIWEEEDKTRKIVPFNTKTKKNILGENLSNTLLYDYQKNVLLNSKYNYIYTLDVGTGKTYVGLYHYLMWAKDNVNLFIVAPSQKVKELGWDKSIRTLEKLHNIQIHYSILSYDKFKKLHLSEIKNYYVILDECHFIKSYKSQRSKNIRNLLKESQGFCLLSATPYSNGDIDTLVYLELFNIIDNISKFLKKIGIYQTTYFSKGYNILTGIKNIDNEKNKLKQYSSPALKLKDCVELPDIIENTTYVTQSNLVKSLHKYKKDNIKTLFPILLGYMDLETSDLIKALYEDEDEILKEDSKMNKLVKDLKKYHTKIIELLPKFKLEQLLSLPGINTLERQLINLEEKSEYCKMFRNETDNNIVIFYNYNIEKEYILKSLKSCENYDENNIYEISGERNNVPFNKIETLKNATILVQYKAGGAGIELQFANICIFFSPTYSYQDFYQAIGRVYRNGQKNKTIFHYLIGENTIESKIYKTLIKKQDFVDNMNDIYDNTASISNDNYYFMSNSDLTE